MTENKSNKEGSNTSSPSNRKGSTNDDVSDSSRELAQNALNEFNKGNYSASASLLNKLQTSRPKDIKVLANKAVLDYYMSCLRKTEIFQKALIDICSQACIKMGDIKSGDEIEASAIRLNRCTVLFHLRQLNAAKSLLESMYKGLESLAEENVSIGLCLLLAETLLGLSLPGRAFAVVAHTEATFLPPPLQPQASSANLHTDKENVSKNSTNSLDSADSSAPFKRTNIIGHDSAETDSITGSSEMRCSADQGLLRCKLQLLRVRSLLQMRAVKVAKKELKALLSHSNSSNSAQGVTLNMLKIQLEYLSGNFKKAVKFLEQGFETHVPSMPPLVPSNRVAYHNNLGVVSISLKKPTVACLHFQKAVNEFRLAYTAESAGKDDSPLNRPLYSNCGGTWSQLCYNFGVSLMLVGKFAEAFDCLVEVAKAHSSNPRLWLRLAECCVAVHRSNVYKHKGEYFHYKVIGSGEHRKICLDTHIGGHNKKLSDQQSSSDPALPVPTLEFGRLCFLNCLTLIPDDLSTSTCLTEEQEAAGLLPDLFPSSPSSPMRGPQAVEAVKMRCLAGLAYTSLCLGDYIQAHERASCLLALIDKAPKFDPALKLLGHFYAGEALALLGRSSEALAHFDPKLVTDAPILEDSVPLGFANDENEVWIPMNAAVGAKMLYYNMSVAFALRKQFEKSYILLREVFTEGGKRLPAQVIMLALYLNLQLGYMESVGPIAEKGREVPYL